MYLIKASVERKVQRWQPKEAAARRALRLLVGVFTGLLWIDNLTEHYRGAFRFKAMWTRLYSIPSQQLWASWRRFHRGVSGSARAYLQTHNHRRMAPIVTMPR